MKNVSNAFRALAVATIVSATFLIGCQSMVEKENMDAIGKWAIDMCNCSEKGDAAEAKACADALKKPHLESMTSSGRPKYKLDSIKAYDEIEGTGTVCQAKIMAR